MVFSITATLLCTFQFYFTFPLTVHKDSVFPTNSPILVINIFWFFDDRHPNKCELILPCGVFVCFAELAGYDEDEDEAEELQ